MPNYVYYIDQTWDDDDAPQIDGEALSVNGRYEGEHIGTPTQDAADTVVSGDPHYVSHHTPHMGTIAQDADTDANMPTKSALTLTLTLTGCEFVGDYGLVAGNDFIGTVIPAAGYTLPATITVNDGAALVVNTDYTWDDATGELHILGSKVDANTTITITATTGT